MATYATLTVNAEDIIGADFDRSRASVWVEANTPNGLIVVDGTTVRVGGRRENLVDGTAAFELVTTDSADNPASFGYRVTIVYVPKGSRKQGHDTITTSDFPFTASANLASIDEAWDNVTAPPEWRSVFRTEMETLRDQAEASAAAADSYIVADLNTSDGQMEALIESPTSLTAAAFAVKGVTRSAQVAHAPGLGLFFPEAEGAVGNGTTNDRAAVKAAYNAAVANPGGGEVVLSKPYRLSSTLDLTDGTKGVRIVGRGGELRPDAGVTAVRLASGVMTNSRPTILVGVRVVGTGSASGSVGLEVRDHFNATARDCHFYDLGVGIRITEQTKWSESSVLDNVYVSNCAIGVELVTGGGTGSLGYATWTHVNIDNVPENGTAFKIGAGVFFYHSKIELLNVHSSSMVMTGIQIDGDIGRNTEIRTLLEGSPSIVGTDRKAIVIGSAGILDGCRLATYFAGNWNTRIVNPSNKPYQIYYDRDRQRVSRASTENIVEYYVDGETNPRMSIRPGRILFGSGASSTLDVGMTRAAADLLALDSGDGFKVDGTWNGGRIRHGNWQQWVDSSQIWRIKSSDPTSETDGNIVVAGLLSANTANLANVAAGINTAGKYIGKCVFNTNTNKPVWATGSTAASTWVDATGTVAHTPI